MNHRNGHVFQKLVPDHALEPCLNKIALKWCDIRREIVLTHYPLGDLNKILDK